MRKTSQSWWFDVQSVGRDRGPKSETETQNPSPRYNETEPLLQRNCLISAFSCPHFPHFSLRGVLGASESGICLVCAHSSNAKFNVIDRARTKGGGDVSWVGRSKTVFGGGVPWYVCPSPEFSTPLCHSLKMRLNSLDRDISKPFCSKSFRETHPWERFGRTDKIALTTCLKNLNVWGASLQDALLRTEDLSPWAPKLQLTYLIQSPLAALNTWADLSENSKGCGCLQLFGGKDFQTEVLTNLVMS